jgi:long-subunit fatty acid transport protein
MPFERLESRPRSPRARGAGAAARLAPAAVAAALLIAWPARVPAAPLDEPFIGGLSFTGPTSANLASVYWNPAALGLVHGLQLMVSASGRLTTTTVARASIDPRTGLPGAGFSPATATARDFTQPIHWPLGPGGFLGIGWDLGGDRVTLAFAMYEPFVQQVHYPLSPTGDEPTRYHALNLDLRNVALVPALAIRVAGDLRVGIAPGLLFSTGRLSFADDLALEGGTEAAGLKSDCLGQPCGAENPAAAARYDIDSGQGLGDAKVSFTLGAGLYYRRRTFEFGLAYASQPIGTGTSGVEVAAENATVGLPPRTGGGPLTCAGGLQTIRCVSGDFSYHLPDTFTGGITWHLGPGLELTAMARWLWFHQPDNIDIRLAGTTLDAAGIPQHIVLYRGFHDMWDTRLRIAYWWRERVRLGAALRFETSALDAAAVSPANVDGPKLQPILLAEVRLSKHLWLGGGYGIAFQSSVTASPSRYSPADAATCTDFRGDLNNPACRARQDGLARPTAEGTYHRLQQDFGATMTARF